MKKIRETDYRIYVPLEKQSPGKRREYYAGFRGNWNGLSPVTRTKGSLKYERAREKRKNRECCL